MLACSDCFGFSIAVGSAQGSIVLIGMAGGSTQGSVNISMAVGSTETKQISTNVWDGKVARKRTGHCLGHQKA